MLQFKNIYNVKYAAILTDLLHTIWNFFKKDLLYKINHNFDSFTMYQWHSFSRFIMENVTLPERLKWNGDLVAIDFFNCKSIANP